MTQAPYLITAIGTPLDADEHLCQEGLEQHLADQAQAGIDGILAAGSMGLMQMLRGDTYETLARRCSELWHGKGELLLGVGDAGCVRTLERDRNRLPISDQWCRRAGPLSVSFWAARDGRVFPIAGRCLAGATVSLRLASADGCGN